VINVDWYFNLHWKDRIFSKMTSDFEVTVSYSETSEDDSESLSAVIPLSLQRSSISPFSNLHSFINAIKILRNDHFDLIHSVTIKPNLFFGILARLYSIPILITIPGMGTTFSSHGLKFKLLRKLIIFLYRFAGKNDKCFFIFENKQNKMHFLKENICSPENSTVVSGAGINLKKFIYTEETSPGSHPVKLLFAARLLKGKGLEDLIEAAALVNTNEIRVDLYVAGITDTDSKETIPLAQIKGWHTDGRINYLGQIDDMPELLSNCHIIALPTKYGEGLPRILLEANACGRPVITTDIAGCNDFVEDRINGLLVNPGSVVELSEAIEKLLDPIIRKAMGLAGRQKVEKSYSREHVIDQYRVVYKKILQQYDGKKSKEVI